MGTLTHGCGEGLWRVCKKYHLAMGISSLLVRLVMCIIWPYGSTNPFFKGLSMSAYPMSIYVIKVGAELELVRTRRLRTTLASPLSVRRTSAGIASP